MRFTKWLRQWAGAKFRRAEANHHCAGASGGAYNPYMPPTLYNYGTLAVAAGSTVNINVYLCNAGCLTVYGTVYVGSGGSIYTENGCQVVVESGGSFGSGTTTYATGVYTGGFWLYG